MKKFLITVVTTAAAMALVSLTLVPSAAAQAAGGAPAAAAKAAPAGPIPRMANGHPDLSGVWWPGQDVAVQTLTVAGTDGGRTAATSLGPRPNSFGALYKPEFMAKAKTLGDKDDPTLLCIPSVMGQGTVIQIVQTPKFVLELNETYHGFRVIPTDGRPHADDFAPSYKGDGVGQWEGDTFVVDVTNFTDRNWIADHSNVSFHTTALHQVQTYRLVDANTIEIASTFEDPNVLTGPWKTSKTWKRAPFDRIMETFCSGVETKPLLDAAAKENYGRK